MSARRRKDYDGPPRVGGPPPLRFGEEARHSLGDGDPGQSMIPKKPAPDLIRGGNRFSEKIMLHQ
jgi:hypothetical protein